MSRESRRNNYNSVNTEVKEARENKEDLFDISNEEFADFPTVGKVDYRRSLELCSSVSKIFKEVYDDFYGTTFEISPDGEAYLCLWFNHIVNDDNEDRVVAFSQFDDAGNSTGNETVDRVRRYSRRLRQGNQYRITKFGKDGLDKFIKDRVAEGAMATNLRDRNGKVIWSKCAADVAEPQQYYNAQQAQKVFTKVSYIDLSKIYKLIYGDTIVTGIDKVTGEDLVSRVDYKIEVKNPISSPNGYAKDFLLRIDQICQDELDRVLKDVGVGSYSPFGIVNN